MKIAEDTIISKLEFPEFHSSVMFALMERLTDESDQHKALFKDLASYLNCTEEDIYSVFESACMSLSDQLVPSD